MEHRKLLKMFKIWEKLINKFYIFFNSVLHRDYLGHFLWRSSDIGLRNL